MQRILLFFIAITFFACKKSTDSSEIIDFNSVVRNTNLLVIHNNSRDAVIAIKQPAASIVSVTNRLYYREMGTETWLEAPVINASAVPLYGLKAYTAYEMKVGVTFEGQELYSTIEEFVTAKFTVNYKSLYASVQQGKTILAPNIVFSIEGGVHYLSGVDFTHTAEILVRFVAVSNSGEMASVKANVINDTLISFTVPQDLVTNEPFVPQKDYYVFLNDQAIVSEKGIEDKVYDDLAIFHVINSDLGITRYTHEYVSGCHQISFKGYFATSALFTRVPEFLLESPIKVKSRQLLIYNGSSVDKTFDVDDEGEVHCETTSIATADMTQVNAAMIQFHEVTQVKTSTSLPVGSYSAKVVVTYTDGSQKESNFFKFNL